MALFDQNPDDQQEFPSPIPRTTPTPVPAVPAGGVIPVVSGAQTTVPTPTPVKPFSWTPTPYSGPSRPSFNFGPVPVFNPPAFHVPTAGEVGNSAAYKFRLAQGEEALQASAAAKGILRTGGTLKDILGFGQLSASQEYENEFQRALSAYDRQYGAARDKFTPEYNAWALKAGAEQAGGLSAFNQAYNLYTFPITEERLRQQMILEAQARAASGLGA